MKQTLSAPSFHMRLMPELFDRYIVDKGKSDDFKLNWTCTNTLQAANLNRLREFPMLELAVIIHMKLSIWSTLLVEIVLYKAFSLKF
jgi:hypothetical protein